MSELPSLTPHKIIKILEKKGFVLDRIKGSHHIYYHRGLTSLYYNGVYVKKEPKYPVS